MHSLAQSKLINISYMAIMLMVIMTMRMKRKNFRMVLHLGDSKGEIQDK